VAKSHRRRGIATLLHRCIEHAQQLRLAALIAYTQPEWPDASGFYLRHGFRIYGSDSVDVHCAVRSRQRIASKRNACYGLVSSGGIGSNTVYFARIAS
jgi:N-acetylglutamate synthase-like GNAT family acetyltransferase